LCNNFDEAGTKTINNMFATWYAVRNPGKTGRLDIAIEEKDTEKIQTILTELKVISNEFISLATRRMEELIKK